MPLVVHHFVSLHNVFSDFTNFLFMGHEAVQSGGDHELDVFAQDTSGSELFDYRRQYKLSRGISSIIVNQN